MFSDMVTFSLGLLTKAIHLSPNLLQFFNLFSFWSFIILFLTKLSFLSPPSLFLPCRLLELSFPELEEVSRVRVHVSAPHVVLPEGLEEVKIWHWLSFQVELLDSLRSVFWSEELSLQILVWPGLVLSNVTHLLIRLEILHLPPHRPHSVNDLLRPVVDQIALHFDVINDVNSVVADIRELFDDAVEDSYLDLRQTVDLVVRSPRLSPEEDGAHLSL